MTPTMLDTTPAGPHHAPQQARPGGPLRWENATLATLQGRSLTLPIAIIVGVVVATVVDVMLMYPAVARVLRHSQELSWATAAGIGILALLVMSAAGRAWRGARGNHHDAPSALVLPALLIAGWATMGNVVMRMRLEASTITTTVAYGGASAAPATASFDTVAAIAFLAVYALCGMLAFYDAYELRNDAYSAGRAAQRTLEKLRKAQPGLEALYVHLRANCRDRRVELDGLKDAATMAKQRNESFAQELKQLARGEMIAALADPTKTGIASPRHPDNPLRQQTDESQGETR